MGSSHIKDENIQIFMQINKQFYISGDAVQGQIYIRVQQPSQYTKLIVGVEGEEYVYWSQGQGNQRRYYKNQYKNYNSYFVVMDFNGLVQQGDYIFPFVFVLPNMITGSYFHSKHCYLKYTIKTQLLHPTEPKRNQFYQMFLNILEPPRNPIGPATTTHTVNSKCCGCCADYGFVSVTLNSDRNFVMNGDLIQINGCVDNSRGNKVVQGRIVLERRRFMVSSRGHVKNQIQEEFQYQRLAGVQPSGNSNFNFSAKVPDTLVSCTAIGKIVANYYILHLYTSYGCCANKADAQLHLVVHSRTPLIVRPQILPQPQNWYPRSFPKVIYQNMSPYLYVPDPKIPFINQLTQQAMNNNFMQQTYPNFTNFTNTYQNNNTQQNTLVEEMSQNRMNSHQNWGNNNYNYKPVFYDDGLVSDAQREHYANMQQNQGNEIFRKL